MPRRSEGPKRFTTLVGVFAMRTMKNLMVQLQIIEKYLNFFSGGVASQGYANYTLAAV
jgi:hypothetical protein